MKQRFLALGCIVSLAFSLLAGCQAAAGVDLGKAVENNLGTSSYQGTQALTLELTPASGLEDHPEVDLLKNVSVTLTDVKHQDATTSSAKGELQYGGNVIPFAYFTADGQILLQVEGAGQPLLTQAPAKAGTGEPPSLLNFDISSLDWEKLLKENASALFKFLPAPESFTAEDVKTAINGEELALKKLHVDVTGSELAVILQTAIKSLLADEAGDALIRSVITQVMGDNGNELATSMAAVVVRRTLNSVSTDINALGEFAQYFTDSNTLKLDLYVDGEAQVRRTELELSLSGLKLMDGAVSGLKAKFAEDRWNINGTVAADSIDGADAVKAMEPGGIARYIKVLEPDSQVYKLLVEELKVTRKNIVLPPIEEGLPGAVARPYIVDGVTLVPVRFVSENLDAEVSWKDDTQQAIVTDIISGKTLVFTIGSKIVLVDGQEVELEAAAALTGEYTYVPVRFIAESFGAEVGWDPETWTVSIIRN